MNKTITEGVNAISEVSLTKVKKQIEDGDIVPSTFNTLPGPEKYYVKLVTFERRSPEEACKIVARKLMEAGSPVVITAEELRVKYMFDKDIKRAIREITKIHDEEYSLSIQQGGKLATSILMNLMFNNPDPEIQLRAASKVADLAAKDYQDKRGKTKIDISQTTSETKITWDIHDFRSKDLPAQDIIDATVISKKKLVAPKVSEAPPMPDIEMSLAPDKKPEEQMAAAIDTEFEEEEKTETPEF